MKVNKWTMGLAAVGVVSLGSIAQAEEKLVPLMTALSSTTLSGYVDTSAIWRPGTGTDILPVGRIYDVQSPNGQSKQDGFNLNVVSITLDKPLDEGSWSAGYHVQTLIGPDASGRGTGIIGGEGEIALNEAYVALRAPVGNGLDFRIGQFGTFVGYESFDSYKNPNYSRSYGFFIEPSAHVGVTASYVFNEMISAMVGVGNSYSTPIDARARFESEKYYLALVTLTAPESTGVIGGSTLTLGYQNGPANMARLHTVNYYAGATIATPVSGLSVGLAFDYAENPFGMDAYGKALAGYFTFQATEKLKVGTRVEWAEGEAGVFDTFNPGFTGAGAELHDELLGLTVTADYALWANVVTRGEVRWDHSLNSNRPFARPAVFTPGEKNSVTLALNVIYRF